MDAAILSATAALAGSLIGATSSFATTWLTQRSQARVLARSQEIIKREALYAEFIAEAAERLVEGLGRNADSLAVVVRLYAAVGRMRLVSSRDVITAAEELVQLVVETYASPNQTFDQLRAGVMDISSDPMRAFGEACRKELHALHG